MNETKGGHARITKHLGVENRKEALRGARFVINAIQVGLYDPCTIIDFEVPKKYGLRQTIGDTLGIGGIMRALRTIPVMDDFAFSARSCSRRFCSSSWSINSRWRSRISTRSARPNRRNFFSFIVRFLPCLSEISALGDHSKMKVPRPCRKRSCVSHSISPHRIPSSL